MSELLGMFKAAFFIVCLVGIIIGITSPNIGYFSLFSSLILILLARTTLGNKVIMFIFLSTIFYLSSTSEGYVIIGCFLGLLFSLSFYGYFYKKGELRKRLETKRKTKEEKRRKTLEAKRKKEEKRRKEEEERRKEEEKRKRMLEIKRKTKFENQQKKKGLIKFTTKSGKEIWAKPSEVKKLKEIEIGLSRNFANMKPFEFERFIEKLFEKMGYKTRLTRKTADYGVDVIAKDKNDIIAIQVKKQRGNIGNRVVQTTLGAMHRFRANKSIIITTSDFTVMAKEQAKGAPIELWNKRILHKMVRKYFIEET